MFLRSLTPEERRAVYFEHILQDIPPSEKKSFDYLEVLRADGVCRMLGLFDDRGLLGYAYIQRPEGSDIELLDFFAVSDGRRNQGLGSRFMALLAEKERFSPGLAAEVEDPDFSCGDKAAEDVRRIAFYEKNGWQDSGLRVTVGQYHCRILTLFTLVSPGQLRISLQKLYTAVFGADWARENTVIL